MWRNRQDLSDSQGCSTLESLVGKQPVEVEGIVVEAEADIGDAVEAQQIEGEATQQGEETRVATDAAGILAQGDIPDVVEAVLDAPVGTDGLGGVSRRQGYGGRVIGGFLTECPVFFTGIEYLGVALDFDQGTKMSVPILDTGTGR